MKGRIRRAPIHHHPKQTTQNREPSIHGLDAGIRSPQRGRRPRQDVGFHASQRLQMVRRAIVEEQVGRRVEAGACEEHEAGLGAEHERRHPWRRGAVEGNEWGFADGVERKGTDERGFLGGVIELYGCNMVRARW